MRQMVRRRPGFRLGALVVGVLAGLLTIVSGAPSASAGVPLPILLAGNPFGALDIVVADVGVIGVAGWAMDPNHADPIDVHIYVDGAGYADVADFSRPDVAAAYPGYGEYHGFASLVPASGGTHQVCVYGINIWMGENGLIGCQSVTVPDGSPFGSLDVVSSAPGAVSFAGWAIDPETADPIEVHVYIDGSGIPLVADGDRGDVGGAFPDYGSAHGFGSQVAASPGSHRVCAYAINVGDGGNSLIGCRTVTVPDGSPFGMVDVAAGGAGVVHVAGWAIDPDTAAPIDVHVYIDGAGVGLTADGSRPDVGNAFAGYGANHGYAATILATPGTHTVCAYGINISAGGNSLLGCRSVTVS